MAGRADPPSGEDAAEPGPSDPGRSEGLLRDERLRRRADYLHAYGEGRRRGGRLATLFYVPNSLPHPRLGITASRKVGKRAVVRQRLKRRVREIYRRWDHRRQLPPLDLVVNLKPSAAAAGFDELRQELERQLGSLLASRRTAGRGGEGR